MGPFQILAFRYWQHKSSRIPGLYNAGRGIFLKPGLFWGVIVQFGKFGGKVLGCNPSSLVCITLLTQYTKVFLTSGIQIIGTEISFLKNFLMNGIFLFDSLDCFAGRRPSDQNPDHRVWQAGNRGEFQLPSWILKEK